MTMQHIKIPPFPWSEPQKGWIEQTDETIRRYLDATYRPDEEDARALDALFIQLAAEEIWASSGHEADWDRLVVFHLVLRLAETPMWDDAWLLHACATLSAFYRWLENEGAIRPDDAAPILAELDRRIAEVMHDLGLVGGPHASN